MAQPNRHIGPSSKTISRTVHRELVELHAGDAAFLWRMRARAARQANYNLIDLARLDLRVEAHLEGLEVAREAGWSVLEEVLGSARPEDVFAASVYALRRADDRLLATALSAAGDDPRAWHAAISACGWASELPRRALEVLLTHENPVFRYVGLGGCAVRRRAPEAAAIEGALSDASLIALRARGARMVGELGLVSYVTRLQHLAEDPEPVVRLSAASAIARFQADARTLPILIEHARSGSAATEPVELAARRLRPAAVYDLFRELCDKARVRQALCLAAAAGLPDLVDDVINFMGEPEMARLAGLALCQITGADLVALKLESQEGEPHAPGPAASEEDEEELDDAAQAARDEADDQADREAYLPVPDAERVGAWWRAERARFAAGHRYLAGRSMDEANLRKTLVDGTQPQRRAAASELALHSAGTAAYNTSQPGFVQARTLLGWT